MSVNLSRVTIIDLTYNSLLNDVKKYQEDTGLDISDMENILYRLLTVIKSDKEAYYTKTILDLTQKVQAMQEQEEEDDNSNDQS